MTQLCKLFRKNTQKNSKGTVTNVISNSAKNGLIPQKDYFDKDIANSDNTAGYYIISKNDFVYNPRKSTDAPYGPISRYTYDVDGIVSPLYLCFRGNEAVNPEYFERYFRSSAWHRYIYMSGDSGARHDRVSIKDETFFEMPIHMPGNEEQKKIAAFISLIEKKIECHSALVENLKKYKRGVIRGIFTGKLSLSEEYSFECWKSKKISDCLSYEQPQKYIVDTEKYDHSFQTPVLTANKAFVLGYTNEKHGIYDKGDVIIYDDFTMDMKYVTFPFKVKSSTIKMLTSPQGNDLYFMYSLLQSLNLQPEGHQRTYISKVEPMTVKIPPFEMQTVISNFLKEIDRRVELSNRQLDLLTIQKQGLLQSLFL